MVKPYAQDAELKRLELIAGIASVADVVRWADATLGKLAGYDDPLANLSMAACTPAQDLEFMLRGVSAGANTLDAIRVLCREMHLVLLRDPSRARDFTRVLEHCWIEHNYVLPDDLAFIAGLDDEYSLAERGILATEAEAFKSLMENLSRFDDSEENQIRRAL